VGPLASPNSRRQDQDYFIADEGFALGDVLVNTSQPVSTGNAFLAGPAAIYADARQGDHFSYTLTGLQPGLVHVVILHFAELYWSLPLQRRFDVSINGAPVLTDFDIVSAANGPFRAVTQLFFVSSNADGSIEVEFSRGSIDQPLVSGIEVRFISG